MNNLPSAYRKRTILLIVVATILRLLLSAWIELNNDEVYYWTYAKQLQWNYFDHPPMVAVCIRFFTAGLQWNHELFIRLTSVTGAAICTWLMFLIGRKCKDEYTGWIAACFFTASFYSSVIAGALILPDAPQLVFWLLSVYLMIAIIRENDCRRLNTRLLLLGIIIGFCILSKIHGVFCWIGFGGYVLFSKRSLFKNPFFYISIIITILMLVPSMLWSLQNNMSTYDYHSSRVVMRRIQLDSFVRELTGSFFYNNPVNIILLISACIYFFKQRLRSPYISLLLWLGLPLIITVLFLSVFNDTLPHWSGPAYTTLIPVTALYLRQKTNIGKLLKGAIAFTSILLVLSVMIIRYWPGTIGKKILPNYGKDDVTLDMCGWRQFGKDFQQFYQQELRSHNDTPRYILSNYWFPAAHLDFYVARPSQLSVLALGSLNDIHHFAWLNKKLPSLKSGETAYYITVSNYYDPPSAELKRYFKVTPTPSIIPQYRAGKIARYFYVYRCTHL